MSSRHPRGEQHLDSPRLEGKGTAWQDSATRWGWLRTVLFRGGVMLLWLASVPAWLCAVVLTPPWLLVVWLPVLFVLLYGNLLGVGNFSRALRMRRVLRVYPWQVHHGVAHTARNGTTRLVLPNPDRPQQTVGLGHGDYLGSGLTFWVRRVKAGGVDEVWFAGDPRFVGVVATPGPRRLLYCFQPEARKARMSPRRRGVSPAAKERARAAGARVG